MHIVIFNLISTFFFGARFRIQSYLSASSSVPSLSDMEHQQHGPTPRLYEQLS